MRRLAWAVAIVFAMLGATASGLRVLFVDELASRVEPVRNEIFDALGLSNPIRAERAELVKVVDERFDQHRPMIYAHVVLGACYVLFGLLQFSGSIRRRYVAYHRWAGRILLMIGFVMAVAGMFFGLIMPFAGPAESFVIGIAGAFFLFAMARGFSAIRRRQREAHRIWMTRAFAIALGITTVRLVATVLDLIMTPMGYATKTTFVVSVWVGWTLTVLAAEWWLMRTRLSQRELQALPA